MKTELEQKEKEKEAMVLLKKTIAVCLKKGFHFSVNPECSMITVSVDRFKTAYDSYYKGNLIDYRDRNDYPLKDLFEILKYK